MKRTRGKKDSSEPNVELSRTNMIFPFSRMHTLNMGNISMQHQHLISLSINPSETLATHPSVWHSTDVGVLDYTAHDRAWRWPDKAVRVLTQPDANQSNRWIALKVVGGGVNMAFYSLLPHVTRHTKSPISNRVCTAEATK